MTGMLRKAQNALKAALVMLLAVALALLTCAVPGFPESKAFAREATSSVLESNVGHISQYNGDTYVHDFDEGVLGVDGEVAFCMDPNVDFKPGQVVSDDIVSIASQDKVTDMALRAYYARNVYSDSSVPETARILIAQTLIWEVLSPGQFFIVVASENGGRFPEVTYAVREDMMAKARDFAARNHSRYRGYGTLWKNGSSQPVGTLGCDLIVRDSLAKISKHDSESDWNASLNGALGSASLEGARYSVAHYEGVFETAEEAEASGAPARKWELLTDERGIIDLSDPDRYLVSGNLYRDDYGDAVFPLGTYVVREVSPSEGYLLSDAASAIKVEQPGGVKEPSMSGDVTSTGSDAFVTCAEQVKRGDLSLLKVREDDMTCLSGVPFLLTSVTTGESHVVVTDEDGRIDTSASKNAHVKNTNANDAALKADGSVDEDLFDAAAGVWFGLRGDGSIAEADDALGALPYDTYTITELRSSANSGLELVSLPGISVTSDGAVLDLGTVADKSELHPYVTTYASDSHDGDKSVSAERHATVTDEVKLFNLTPGTTYQLYGTVVDVQTGLPVMVSIQQDLPEEDAAESGDEGVSDPSEETSPVDESESIEELQSAGGVAQASEEELREYWDGLLDMLGVVGTETEQGTSYEIPADTEIDTAAIRAYMDDNKDVSSGVILASTEVMATSPEMSALLDYDMDASAMEGGYVIFDLLVSDGKATAVHADPSNEMESFEVFQPSLSTEATDSADGDHMLLPSMDASVTDTVSYSGLLAGSEYVMSGAVVNKADGSILYVDGKPVVAENTFVPEAASGSVQLQFGFDSTDIAPGTELVVFEFLTKAGEDIAEHSDLDADSQTVTMGSIPTGKGYYKTGAEGTDYLPAVIAAAAAAAAMLFLGRRKLRGRKNAW